MRVAVSVSGLQDIRALRSRGQWVSAGRGSSHLPLRLRPCAALTVSFLQVWADRGDEINKRLTDEAFQKAIRLAMKQYLFEVVDLMSADIAAEAAFVRFWAERTSASMIMQVGDLDADAAEVEVFCCFAVEAGDLLPMMRWTR